MDKSSSQINQSTALVKLFKKYDSTILFPKISVHKFTKIYRMYCRIE